MKYRWSAFATVPYGSGRASRRALYCLYCFFCSSEPVRVSIQFAISVVPFGVFLLNVCHAVRERVPTPPELPELISSALVERVHLARRTLLGRHLLDVDEPLLLDAHEDGV